MRKSNVSAIELSEGGRIGYCVRGSAMRRVWAAGWLAGVYLGRLAGRHGGRRGVIWDSWTPLCGSRGSGHAIEGSGVCSGSSIIGHTV